MRAAILAIGDYPDGNATALRLKLMAKAFQLSDVEVSVELLQATLKNKELKGRPACGVDEGVSYTYLNGSAMRPASLGSALWDTGKGIVGALRFILKEGGKNGRLDFVVVYTPSIFRHGLPILLAKVMRIPMFVEACEIRSKGTGGSRRRYYTRLLDKGESVMEWLIPKIAWGILPISSRIETFYLNKGASAERVFHLPILVDADLYSKPSADSVMPLVKKKYFLNSGSFAEKDGVEFVIDAFAKVAVQYSDICLVFTGLVSERNRREVEAKLLKKGLEDRVLFTGMLSRSGLVWAYQHADALLCCRTNSEYAAYGFPTKLGEYLATGTPVIATRVGDIDQYLVDGKSVYMAEAEDVSSISECMLKLLVDPEKAGRVGKAGQKVARQNFHYAEYAVPLKKFICDSGVGVSV